MLDILTYLGRLGSKEVTGGASVAAVVSGCSQGVVELPLFLPLPLPSKRPSVEVASHAMTTIDEIFMIEDDWLYFAIAIEIRDGEMRKGK